MSLPFRRWLARRKTRRWAERNLLGGYAVYLQVAEICRRSIAIGKRRLQDKIEAERRLAFWPTWERERDQELLDSLATLVPPRTDETDDAYDDRLWAVVANLRGRLEAPPLLAFVGAPTIDPTPARVGSENEGPQVVVLNRTQIRMLNKRIWTQYHRRPTPQEMREEARRLGAI